jgi:hypothetical protein
MKASDPPASRCAAPRECAAPARHERHRYTRLDQHVVAAHDTLVERDRSAAHLLRRRAHLEHVLNARGLEELDLHRAHHEGKARRLLLGLLEQCALVGTEKPQVVGAPAL